MSLHKCYDGDGCGAAAADGDLTFPTKKLADYYSHFFHVALNDL